MNTKLKILLFAIVLLPLLYWSFGSSTHSYFGDIEISTGNTFTAGIWRAGTVNVDVHPGSCPNPLNVKSTGVLPVALLGTQEWPVYDLDPESVRVWREESSGNLIGGNVEPLRYSYEDTATPFDPTDETECCHNATGDGIADMNVKFDTSAIVDDLGLNDVHDMTTIYLKLTVNVVDGEGTVLDTVIGGDCVLILNNPETVATTPIADGESSVAALESHDTVSENDE